MLGYFLLHFNAMGRADLLLLPVASSSPNELTVPASLCNRPDFSCTASFKMSGDHEAQLRI